MQIDQYNYKEFNLKRLKSLEAQSSQHSSAERMKKLDNNANL